MPSSAESAGSEVGRPLPIFSPFPAVIEPRNTSAAPDYTQGAICRTCGLLHWTNVTSFMRLFLDIGHCDRSVRRGVLAGRTIAIVSDEVAGSDHGALLACAEGLAERPDAERAAKTATTALGDTYYTAVETDAPQNALAEAFDAANIAVRSGGDRGRAAVLGGLVLHGRRWVVGHIGNVRVWRYRDQEIKQITRDHLVPRALRQTEVTRACGLAETVAPECGSGALQEGDVFLISSPKCCRVRQYLACSNPITPPSKWPNC